MTDPVPVDPVPVFARRAARIAASAVLLVGIVVVVAAACERWNAPYMSPRTTQLHAQTVLGVTWATAIVVAAAAHGLVRLLRPAWRSARLFAASLILPALALALLLPLTLHAVVFAVCTASASDFDDWVVGSMVITGLAHVVFAALCAVRVQRLLAGQPAMTAQRIFGFTIAAAAVPSLLCLGFPLAIVALTGLPLVPMFRYSGRVVERERAELAAIPEQLPRAALVIR